MKYKNYEAVIRFDEGDQILHGRVLNVRDVISFHGKSIKEVRQAFEEAVDDYLADCAEQGRDPEKPFSGKFVVRVKPEVHRQAVILAAREHVSLNVWLASAVEDKIQKTD
jgi:predicted HicB family RNase H-like nuclease